MSDETKTGGEAQPKSATAEPAEKATVTASDSAAQDGVQKRIDAITAEKKLALERAEAAERKAKELEDKLKSESELAMEKYAEEKISQFRATEFEPLSASAKQMEEALNAEIAIYREKVPEDKRPKSFDSLGLVPQLEAWRALAAGLGTGVGPAINSGGNPPTDDGKIIRGSDIRKWNQDPSVWREHREEVLAAQNTGRIKWDE